MQLFVQYGTYNHSHQEVSLAIDREELLNDAGTPYSTLNRFTLNGTLFGDSVLDMDNKVRALESAYAKNNQDFAVRTDTGFVTYLSLKSSDCIGGLQVIQKPSFPTMERAAYVTYLPYTIMIEGEVPLTDGATFLFSFRETLTKSGGGPRFGLLETLNTQPVPQFFKRATIYRATQEGEAVGLYGWPSVPGPLWPQWQTEEPRITVGSPRRRGAGADRSYQMYPISWSYQFESSVPLVGAPNRWGGT